MTRTPPATTVHHMKFETKCPACAARIPVWRVMATPTPWHLKCGSCGRRLHAVGLTVPALVSALVVALPLGWYGYGLIASGRSGEALAFAIAGIVVFELFISLY